MSQDALHTSSAGPPAEACEVDVSTSLPAWGGYLSRHGGAGIWHDPRWGGIMADAYGNRPFYLTARRSGAVVGVLTLVAQKSWLFGSHLCSLPYFDASGILADDGEAREALLSRAEATRAELGVAWAELRQMDQLEGAPPARIDKVTLYLELPDDSEVLWKSLKAKVRNQVRKAEKADLTAHDGGPELLGEFYAVYVRNMRDLGSPPHGRGFFRRVAEGFGEALRVFVVRQGEKALAASLTLRDAHGLHVPWAGSDWRARDLCPNMLLYWRMLTNACDTKAGRFDFGRSTPDEGTYRFKTQWGAEPVQLYWHYLMPEGREVPDLRPDSPKYRFLVACWKKLPLWAARALGPRIIAKLS